MTQPSGRELYNFKLLWRKVWIVQNILPTWKRTENNIMSRKPRTLQTAPTLYLLEPLITMLGWPLTLNLRGFLSHPVIDPFYRPEAIKGLDKLTKETGLTFHLFQELISAILGEIYGKVRAHKDYQDDRKNDSGKSLLKIKPYDIINDQLWAGYLDF